MSENPVVPDPASKGTADEKWKAIVDSVLEFIAASKVMLQVLNERLLDDENLQDWDNTKLMEENNKLKFYEDLLNAKLKAEPKSNTPLRVSKECQDNGDTIIGEKIENQINDTILNKRTRKFTSRIPRTKSCIEERNKCSSVDRSHYEGNETRKYNKFRKPSEIGYSIIHQRSRTPKGDQISKS